MRPLHPARFRHEPSRCRRRTTSNTPVPATPRPLATGTPARNRGAGMDETQKEGGTRGGEGRGTRLGDASRGRVAGTRRDVRMCLFKLPQPRREAEKHDVEKQIRTLRSNSRDVEPAKQTQRRRSREAETQRSREAEKQRSSEAEKQRSRDAETQSSRYADKPRGMDTDTQKQSAYQGALLSSIGAARLPTTCAGPTPVCPRGQGGGLKIHCRQLRVGSNPTAGSARRRRSFAAVVLGNGACARSCASPSGRAAANRRSRV